MKDGTINTEQVGEMTTDELALRYNEKLARTWGGKVVRGERGWVWVGRGDDRVAKWRASTRMARSDLRIAYRTHVAFLSGSSKNQDASWNQLFAGHERLRENRWQAN